MVFTLIIGSLATFIPRILESTPCDNHICPYGSTDVHTNSNDSTVNTIHAPLYSGLMVFLASSLGLPIYYLWIQPPTSPTSTTSSSSFLSLLTNTSLWCKLLIPSLLNVSGTVAQLCALLYIPAAVLAGMRGILILGTAILSKITKLPDAPQGKMEWFYIFLSVLATTLIGGATITETTASTSVVSTIAMVYGILLCMLGYILAAGQATLEAHTLDAGINKWIILGIEGIIGSSILFTVLGILTAFPSNTLEQPQHTLCCLQHESTTAIPLSISYGMSSLIFNTLLLTLSSLLGANLRVFIFTARGILTLTIETSLYYISSATRSYGTIATPWLILEIIGFILLIYSGLARVQLQTERSSSNRLKEEKNENQQALLSSTASSLNDTDNDSFLRTYSQDLENSNSNSINLDDTTHQNNAHNSQRSSSSSFVFTFSLPAVRALPTNDGMSRSSLSLRYDPGSGNISGKTKGSLYGRDNTTTTTTYSAPSEQMMIIETTHSLLVYDPTGGTDSKQ